MANEPDGPLPEGGSLAGSQCLISVATVLEGSLDGLRTFLEAVVQALGRDYPYFEILLIDNAGSGATDPELRDSLGVIPNCRVVQLSRRYPTEVAIVAAVDHAIGDYLVILDLERDPPSAIPHLLDVARSGFDVVIGTPLGLRERPSGTLRAKVLRTLLGAEESTLESRFRVLSRRVILSLTKVRSRYRQVGYWNAVMGFRQTRVSYEPKGAPPGSKERPFERLVRTRDLVVAHSVAPLRIASLIGVVASLLNLAYFVYILVVTLVKRRLAEGWLTTSLTHTTMFLALFLILAILSEYIGQILMEARDEPLYFVLGEETSRSTRFDPERRNVV